MIEAIALCLSSIHDGDTLRLCDGTRVRLVAESGAVDAPELDGSPPCRDARRETRWCDNAAALRSRDELARHLTQSAQLDCFDQDRYGRSLCRIRVNGRDVGDMMLASGHLILWGARR